MRSKATEDNVVRLCCITPGLSRLITRTCTRVGRIRSIPYRSVRTFFLPLFSTLRLKALEGGGEGDQRFIIYFLENEKSLAIVFTFVVRTFFAKLRWLATGIVRRSLIVPINATNFTGGERERRRDIVEHRLQPNKVVATRFGEHRWKVLPGKMRQDYRH